MHHGDMGFNGGYDQVVAAMDRILAQLPPPDRGDVQAVRDFVAAAAHPDQHPGGIKSQLYAYAAAIPRIDARLKRECGITFGKAGFPFLDLRPPATTAPPANGDPVGGARP